LCGAFCGGEDKELAERFIAKTIVKETLTKVNQKARKNLRLGTFFPQRDLSDEKIARAGLVKNVDCPRTVPHRQSQLMHMVMHSGVFPQQNSDALDKPCTGAINRARTSNAIGG